MPDAIDTPHIDGRIARSQRTRAAILAAVIELLEDGSVQPTVEEVAGRAGVAPRTVFQHYPDRETLFEAVSKYRGERTAALMEEIPVDVALPDRLERFVAQRARVLEDITPVRRAALLLEPVSDVARESVQRLRAIKRDQVSVVFAPELEACDAEGREVLRAALAAAASWAAWDALRWQQGLDVGAASAAMHRTLHALLHVR